MKFSKIKLLVLSSIIAVGGLFLGAHYLKADTGSDMYGYAWSSNIGWIKFNDCTTAGDASSCDSTAGYGVKILPTAPGTITGFAWSPNIGWITFNDPSCPTTSCTPGAHADWAHANTDGSVNIKGWARACSVYVSGCSGALNSDSALGSWDGYIALDSTTAGGKGGPWGFVINKDNTITGFAWGSEVIGWIKSITANLYLNGPVVNLTANPAVINAGASSVLTTTATNIDGPNACAIVGIAGLVMKQGSDGSWTGTVSVSPSSTTTYTVNCTKGTQKASATATVTVNYFGTPGGQGSNGGGYCPANNEPQFSWDSGASQCVITRNDGKTETVTGSSSQMSSTTIINGRSYYMSTLAVIGSSSSYTLQCTKDTTVPVKLQLTVNSCSGDYQIIPSVPAGTTSLSSDYVSEPLTQSNDGKTMTAVFNVDITPNGGFGEDVTYSFGPLPTGVPSSLTASFSPVSVSATNGTYQRSQMTISIPTADVVQGASYKNLVITGTSTSGVVHTAKVSVGATVKIRPIFNEF